VVEAQWKETAKALRKCEASLAQSDDPSLRRLGKVSNEARGKVVQEIWLRRSEEQAVSRSLLDLLEKLRREKSSPSPLSLLAKDWPLAPPALARQDSHLRNSPSKGGLLDQIRLERSYYDTLLKFRSLTLQLSFLKTLESLENPRYEMIDPPSVQIQSKAQVWFLGPLVGGLFFSLLGLLRPR